MYLGKFASAVKASWLCAAAAFGLLISTPHLALAADKLSLGYVSADAVYGPWFYAQEKGFFTKHGLETTLAFTDSGMKGVQALIGESIEICSCDSPSTVTAHLAGGDIKFIGATLSVLSGNVYAGKDIKSPAELKGKRWAISSFGSEAHTAAQLAIKSFGLTEQDVTVVQVGNQGNRFAALESGQVQVTTLLPPVSSRAETAGYPKLAELPKLAPDYLSIGPVMSMKTLNARRPVVKRFLMALAEATVAYQKDKEGGVAAIQKYLKIANEKDAELAWAYYSPLNSVTLRPSDASIQFILDRSTDPKAKTSKPGEFMDLTLIDELEKEGFFKTLK
jgi:NitT/TauT family transport system substrate-binding protein